MMGQGKKIKIEQTFYGQKLKEVTGVPLIASYQHSSAAYRSSYHCLFGFQAGSPV